MVIESFVGPIEAEKHPSKLIFLGFLYASIGLFLAQLVFTEQASLVMVFFTTMACIPLMHNTMRLEEKKDILFDTQWKIFNEHRKAISFFLFLFIGLTLAYSFWYVFLPDTLASNLFEIQSKTIVSINNRVSGNFDPSTRFFFEILFNNFKVMIFCILFSFIYGSGSIFIIVWNATVISAAIGNLIKTSLLKLTLHQSISYGFLRYFIHGVPEITAYLFAGLAGGIISVAVIRHDYATSKFENILLDASELIAIGVAVLIVAAYIETYITPSLF